MLSLEYLHPLLSSAFNQNSQSTVPFESKVPEAALKILKRTAVIPSELFE